MIWAAFRLLPIGAQWAIAGVTAALALGSVYSVYSHIEGKGYARAIAEIAAQDEEAVNAAREARDRVRDCRNAGGVWDTTRGDCDRR